MGKAAELTKKEYVANRLRDIIRRYPKQAEYQYTHSIIELIKTIGPDVENSLKQILYEATADESKIELSKIALYSLCYYYKRYTKNELLLGTIQANDELLSVHPLKNEIISWYYRNIGDYEHAYHVDKAFCQEEDLANINVVQFISFASSVAYLLEQEVNDESYSFWSSNHDRNVDWNSAVDAMGQAMSKYSQIRPGKKYAKHYTILGRLYLYAPALSETDIDKAYSVLEKANAYFRDALQYEDENSDDYFRRFGDIQRYQGKIELSYMRVQFKKSAAELDERIVQMSTLQAQMKADSEKQIKNITNTLNDKSNEISKMQLQMKTDVENQHNKSVEIITIYTAVIAVVLGGLEIMSNFSFSVGVVFITLFGLLCCELVCVLCIILDTGKRVKRAIILAIICLIPIIIIITVAILHRFGFVVF